MFDAIRDGELRGVLEVAGLQKWNLVLVLLVSQFVQVLLLSVAVLVFFLVFGSVVMQPERGGVLAAARDTPTDVTGPAGARSRCSSPASRASTSPSTR